MTTETKTATWFGDHSYLECAICGERLLQSRQHCTTCMTPLELSKTVSARGADSQFVIVLGASGAGKTVFLGMLLEMLHKGGSGLCGLPNGAFSLAVQEQTVNALESQRFPDKTSSEPDRWKWVHCEAFDERRSKERIDLITPDLAGEALALELEQPNTFPTIRMLVEKAKGLLLLFDSQRVRDAGRSEDLFGVKLLTYVMNLHMRIPKERRKKVRVPLSMVLTKTDACVEAMEDVNGFAATYLPGTVQCCRERFSAYQFFAASAVGSVMRGCDEFGSEIRIPLHVQPRGIVEPIRWVMQHLE